MTAAEVPVAALLPQRVAVSDEFIFARSASIVIDFLSEALAMARACESGDAYKAALRRCNEDDRAQTYAARPEILPPIGQPITDIAALKKSSACDSSHDAIG